MTSKLTKDQLEAIRLRYERSSGGYWMVEDGCYVCDVSNTRKVNDGEDYVGSVVIADCVKGKMQNLSLLLTMKIFLVF